MTFQTSENINDPLKPDDFFDFEYFRDFLIDDFVSISFEVARFFRLFAD